MRFFKKKLIYKQEMVEMILFNEIKMPVGASRERLMSDSLSRFVQNTESFNNESDGCCEMWFRLKCK